MSNYIRQIQADLKAAGLYKGEIDGIAGKLTVEAVNKAIKSGVVDKSVKGNVAELGNSDPEIKEKQTKSSTKDDNFVFSNTSIKRLEGVNNTLVAVVKSALTKSKQDFAVLEGLRSKERQAELVHKGASQTMNSKHLIGEAVDLVPIVNGKVSWDWKYYYAIADAMREAGKELNVRIRWGGAWIELTNTTKATTTLVEEYVADKRKEGKKAFTDAPHFEILL